VVRTGKKGRKGGRKIENRNKGDEKRDRWKTYPSDFAQSLHRCSSVNADITVNDVKPQLVLITSGKSIHWNTGTDIKMSWGTFLVYGPKCVAEYYMPVHNYTFRYILHILFCSDDELSKQ